MPIHLTVHAFLTIIIEYKIFGFFSYLPFDWSIMITLVNRHAEIARNRPENDLRYFSILYQTSGVTLPLQQMMREHLQYEFSDI